MVEITDEKSAVTWLEAQDHSTKIWMSTRSALRALPGITFLPEPMVLNEALNIFRNLLASAISCQPSYSLRNAPRTYGGARNLSGKFELDGVDSYFTVAPYAAIIASESAYNSLSYLTKVSEGSGNAIGQSVVASASIAALNAPDPDLADDAFSEFAAINYRLLSKEASAPLLWPALWQTGSPPEHWWNAWLKLRALLDTNQNSWGFWIDWYDALLVGNPLDWRLCTELVGQLTDDDWDAGPAHVAERIRDIRKQWAISKRPESVPELEKAKLLKHVRRLLANPDMTALAADGAAEVLERAISEFLNSGVANCLPDALKHLDGLPPIFRRISSLVKSEARSETKIENLSAEIERLNAKVAALEADLKDAHTKTMHGVFKKTYITALAGALGVATVGPLALGTAHFFGVSPTDMTLENLRLWLDALSQAEPATELKSALPRVYDT